MKKVDTNHEDSAGSVLPRPISAQKSGTDMKVSVGALEVGPLAKRLIMETLDKNRLSYGDLTIELENRFSQVHGAKFGLFTVSGTSALQVALHALKAIHGWEDGDEVIVPAITFVATSNVVLANNLKPVFVDVDPVTYNLDPEKIEEAITSRTKAIMPVHLFGQPARMDRIMEIARARDLRVLVDSCETMYVKYQDKPLGAWGDIVCFSSYTAHLLITGVGGFMLTNSPVYAEKMRSLMNHGRDSIYYNIDHDDHLDSKEALFNLVDRRFSFVDVGYSYRLTEMEAALGLEGLEGLADNVTTRQKNAAYLSEGLAPLKDHIQLPEAMPGAEHAFMMYPIVIRPESNVRRADLITYLESHGVETRYMMPLLSQPIYRKLFPGLEHEHPVARWIDLNGFYVGCHQYLKESDLDHIVRVCRDFFESSRT